MWVDSHCHLDDPRLLEDLDGVFQRAEEAGVHCMVTIGTDVATDRKALELARAYPERLRACIGAHPTEAEKLTEEDLQMIEVLARDPLAAAIGEVGLDFHYPVDRRKQEQLFQRMITFAENLKKPLVIHNREADEHVWAILRERKPSVGLLLHCYSAGPNWVERFLKLGCFFSFAGPLTFKNGGMHRDAARLVPLERTMIETDAPYLAPHPHRGKRNEPAYVVLTGECLADVQGRSIEETAAATTRNARAFFSFT